MQDIKLDKYQRKAVKAKNKDVLIIAPAGSGKTFTIVQKVKEIIKQGTQPEEILCISFTNAAAQSLERKLYKEKINSKVKTFHSLGYEIISQYKDVKIVPENLLSDIIDKSIKNSKYLNKIVNAKFKRIGGKSKIYNKLENNIIYNSKYKGRLNRTMNTFVNLYNGQNYKIDMFEIFKQKNKQENIYDKRKRHEYFLNLMKYTIKRYEKILKKNQYVDYNSIINDAIETVKKAKLQNYRYILIDEYQDISMNKAILIKEIKKKTKANIIAVGDDWQSIYAFTGSNLEVFTKFKKIFPKSKIIKLKNTYRNPKEICEISKKFICKNKSQIKKKVSSSKSIPKPIHIYYYDKDISEVWNKIIDKTSNKETLVLGRNNSDIIKIPKIKSNMKYMTIHKSKGLESYYTVIINLENKYNSIPSKIEDSEYLEYVKQKYDSFPYSEERRLFYVALTRSKSETILVVNKNSPSIFVKELIKDYAKMIKIHI